MADYDGISVPATDAQTFVEDAEKFIDRIAALLPSLPVKARRGLSAKQKAEVDILHTLALVFVRASEARGVPLPAGFHEQLIIYGTRSSRMRLITEIDEMKDLAPYVSSRCPEITATVPGFGTVEMGPCYSVPPLHILACLVYRTSKQSEHGGVAERWTAPVPPFWSWCYG